jgi:hypothetical protein
MKTLTLTLLFGTLALIVSACGIFGFTVEEGSVTSSSVTPFAVDTNVAVTGTVVGTIDDCAFDGICALVLDVNGTEVNAIWAEGMTRCEGQYQDDVTLGDTVEAYGIARDSTSLSICPSSEYYIRASN